MRKAVTFTWTGSATQSFTPGEDIVLSHMEAGAEAISRIILSTNPSLTNAILISATGVRDDVIARLTVGSSSASLQESTGDLFFAVPAGSTLYATQASATQVVAIVYYDVATGTSK